MFCVLGVYAWLWEDCEIVIAVEDLWKIKAVFFKKEDVDLNRDEEYLRKASYECSKERSDFGCSPGRFLPSGVGNLKYFGSICLFPLSIFRCVIKFSNELLLYFSPEENNYSSYFLFHSTAKSNYSVQLSTEHSLKRVEI